MSRRSHYAACSAVTDRGRSSVMAHYRSLGYAFTRVDGSAFDGSAA